MVNCRLYLSRHGCQNATLDREVMALPRVSAPRCLRGCFSFQLKFYDVSDGTKLVLRFLERQRQNQRSLWRISQQVALVASQYFLVSAMVVPVHKCKDLVSMMELWMQVRRQVVNIIPDLTRTMVHTAASSRHVFLLANALHTQVSNASNKLHDAVPVNSLFESAENYITIGEMASNRFPDYCQTFYSGFLFWKPVARYRYFHSKCVAQ